MTNTGKDCVLPNPDDLGLGGLQSGPACGPDGCAAVPIESEETQEDVRKDIIELVSAFASFAKAFDPTWDDFVEEASEAMRKYEESRSNPS